MNRRSFLKKSALALPAFSLAPNLMAAASRPANPYVGIQIAPWSLLDEGIENCLDLLQETAGVNSIMCYSQTYHMSYTRPINIIQDHGFGVRDNRERNLPRMWHRTHPEFYRNTFLGHEAPSPDFEYNGRDLFMELLEPAKARGMKVEARILEASANRRDLIPNYERVLTKNIDGGMGKGPCWNHPDYREWIYATIEDLLTHYPLDGLQYGAERTGPLSYLLFSGQTPSCFCEHCINRNRARGIDALSAKIGYQRLLNLVRSAEANSLDSPDGMVTETLRVFQQHPEVLAWNYQWFQADNEIHDEIFRRARAIRPETQIGRHVDHQRSSWDIFYRSAVSYADMTATADYIKPILYHDILGRRLHHWVLASMQQRINRQLSMEQALALFYAWFGHDAAVMPSLDQLDDAGLGPEYVYNETRRAVRAIKGQSKVYVGLGVDVPWHLPEGGMAVVPSPPDRTELAVRRAFDAGADGILISREYDEIRLESLRAIGRAVR